LRKSYSSTTGKKKKHVGMRAAGIAVIAFNRFNKIISHPGYRPLAGIPVKVGRESFVLAPSSIISHIEGNASLFPLIPFPYIV
jgi:hypothetical protein